MKYLFEITNPEKANEAIILNSFKETFKEKGRLIQVIDKQNIIKGEIVFEGGWFSDDVRVRIAAKYLQENNSLELTLLTGATVENFRKAAFLITAQLFAKVAIKTILIPEVKEEIPPNKVEKEEPIKIDEVKTKTDEIIEESKNKFCNKCGKAALRDDVFCSNCGGKINHEKEIAFVNENTSVKKESTQETLHNQDASSWTQDPNTMIFLVVGVVGAIFTGILSYDNTAEPNACDCVSVILNAPSELGDMTSAEFKKYDRCTRAYGTVYGASFECEDSK